MTGKSYILQLFVAVGLVTFLEESRAYSVTSSHFQIQQDTIPKDSVPPEPYKPSKTPTHQEKYRYGDPFSDQKSKSPLQLADPSTIDLEVEVDTSGVQYNVYERIGETNFRPMTTMSFEEYDDYNDKQITKEYFHERSAGLDGESAVSGRSLIPRLYISPMLDRLFGGSYVDIQPNGFVNLDFGGRFQRNDNPSGNQRQQRYGGFNFDQQISMNLVGKVGEKLTVTANFDNNNTFDFQNNLKIEYTGYEEDIVKKIEIGNVSMPVSNSLMTGAQSLFGLKTQLQFGKLFVTTVMSRQQGQSEVITVENGFQGREFEVRGSEYDENRHFFLGHFFRDNYQKWHGNLPQIVSGVNITRVEVYVINRNNETQTTRQIMAFQDLGEPSKIHSTNVTSSAAGGSPNNNAANNLFTAISGLTRNKDNVISELPSVGLGDMVESTDYVKIGTARKLDDSEYSINKQLGYVSLLRKLQNDEMLAVSYEYTFNGEVYKVGELTEDYAGQSENDVIFLKMLRPNKINVDIPAWDLMMKNIYYLNANQIDREGFTLRVRYRDDASGIDNPSLHEGRNTTDIPLVELLKLDQLNQNNDYQKDGNFDFIEGVTINTKSGYIIFPVLEPFGSTLNSYFDNDEAQFKEKYVYQELYDKTQNDAQQIPKKDKFFITGRFNAGSSSEIALPGINIAQGSVLVTAGNTPLTEGLDYTVDYNLGRVRILNEGILSSGKTINIAYEKADVFNFQARWLYGARFDYKFNEKFNIGATIMHLNERRGGITRYQIGDEPTSNTKYGFDISYQEEVPFLTKAMDFLPLVSTKEPSTITVNAEFAQLIPATSNVVNGEGTSYIDDFEGAVNNLSMDGVAAWRLAATPQTNDKRFTNGATITTEAPLPVNDFRAKLAWYSIDASVFYNTGGINKPNNITRDDLNNHYVRPIGFNEIYEQRSLPNYTTGYENSFDIAYYPTERGPYNYNTNLSNFENNPEKNWAGITRSIGTEVDFEKNNVEYIEFWLMDPFIQSANGRVLDGQFNTSSSPTGGKLVFNLGSVSEDVIDDDRHMFESGMPADGDDTKTSPSAWGETPIEPFLTNAFQTGRTARLNQDIGLDGLRDDEEVNKHATFLSANATRPSLSEDPSGDNFRHFLDESYDIANAKILERYKNFNGMDGNTPLTSGAFPQTGAYPFPDNEDLNQDNTVTSLEEYYEYSVNLNADGLQIGQNYIVDKVQSDNNEASWYLFRIPVREWERSFGGISGYKTIRFMRMYLTGFRTPVVLRMVDLQLVKSAWRKYESDLTEPGLNPIPEGSESDFTVSAVNIEGNSAGGKDKVPYVIPPGVNRDQDNTTFYNILLNEQSLQICVDDLEDKDARAVFKNVSLDLLNYGRLKMYFHAHANNNETLLDKEVSAFLRMGTEQADNYYEIEIPLKVTPLELSPNEANIQRLVWPEENELDLSINELLALKSERNRRDIDLSIPYSTISNNQRYKLTVRGNPDLSTLLSMMIGVRNPESPDQASKSACIWANELRVTDFDTNKGWAANARVSTKLADVATINASTRYTSIGFGSIQQTIQQRTREETLGYDVSASVNVDKFLLPHRTGLVVPMFVSYEKTTSTPQFDPLDPDTPLEASLEAFDTQEERDNYKRLVEDRTERRSLNFTNVRKEKVNPEAKQHFYDVENLAFSYAFSEAVSSNVNTQTYLQKTVSGGVSYNYSPPEFRIEPFTKGDAFSSPYLKLIKDINFSPLPSNLSFRANLNRNFRMTRLYDDDLNPVPLEDAYYERLFTFKRSYGLRYNPFKSLAIDYSAGVNAVIDEPNDIIEGDIDTREEKDYIIDRITDLGRMKNFDQDISATYRTPLNKLPFTDWLSADLKYSTGFTWIAGSLAQNDSLGNFFGHTIMNNRNRGATGKVDMNKLYDKVTFLQAANNIKRDEKPTPAQRFLKILMSLKSVNVSYNIRESTTLPGFNKTPFLLGMDSSWSAPGWKFLLGSQDPTYRFRAANNDWLSTSSFLTAPFEQSFATDLGIRASLEPLKDLKIQLDATRTNSARFQEIFRYDTASTANAPNNGFRSLTPSRSGSYSISIITFKTAFKKNRADNSNATFDQFVENIAIMQSRQNQANENPGVYSALSQDVLIPAFLAAYTDQDASQYKTSPFPKIPLPNWRVDYSGLTKIPALEEVFSSVTISHGYRSVYNVNNYTNSLQYTENIALDNNILNYPQAYYATDSNVFIPVYIVNQVSIAEQFTPLLGINLRTKNNLSTKFEYKRGRNLSLQMSNAQVNETQNQDFTFDLGFTKADFKLPFKIKGRTVGIENDVTFRMAMTLRDSENIQRSLESGSKITNGNTSFQFRPTVAYKFNDQLDLTAYFERTVNEPKGRTAYKTATTAFGFQLRFSLAQ
ncbi:cell surface protein SprA [Marinoscillum sp. MHG1-6]|uniref:T9SS outer membrane translocon Sov/SprA n=1 Tax=Marinoscillum sp. MHG1-6 TaxID=2959627 RepID=UPI0021581C41|nr:cell surface protein SprA [Marinoscillum sp. MHG1-6]